jgi:hypothetical protein
MASDGGQIAATGKDECRFLIGAAHGRLLGAILIRNRCVEVPQSTTPGL